jgi:hypothetical protein
MMQVSPVYAEYKEWEETLAAPKMAFAAGNATLGTRDTKNVELLSKLFKHRIEHFAEHRGIASYDEALAVYTKEILELYAREWEEDKATSQELVHASATRCL